MKQTIKYLLICLLFLMAIIAKGQDTLKVPLDDSSKVTFGKVYSDVKSGLKGLGEALKVGAEHVYEVLVRQQVVYAITHLIIILVFGILLARMWTSALKLTKKDSIDDVQAALIIVTIVVAIGYIIYFLAVISTVITGFVNPEYGAIKDIIDFIH